MASPQGKILCNFEGRLFRIITKETPMLVAFYTLCMPLSRIDFSGYDYNFIVIDNKKRM